MSKADNSRANLTFTISKACFETQYAVWFDISAFRFISESPIPDDNVKTFLSEPFLRRGRKALVVRMGPRTLVAKDVLKVVIRESASGL